MFKNVKKALFALVIAFVAVYAFACGKNKDIKEANNENCKEFCETCSTPETCEKCNNASAETCKEFCPTAPECHEASAETCKKFQDYVAPTSFFVDGDIVEVGKTNKVFIDEELWEPENCEKTLVFVSADPAIATVDADGVVTGVRPGKVNIFVYSPLNPEVSDTVEFVVKDAVKNDQDVTDRELADIVAQLPAFVTETTALPETWNQLATVSYAIGTTPVEALEVPADLAEDRIVKLNVTVTLNEASSDTTVDVWLVKDANVNTFVVLESVNALLDNYLAQYVAGEKVAKDLDLFANLYGCAIKWTSSNGSALSSEGKYAAQSEDKNITLDALLQYGTGSRNLSYKLTAKGYTADEKADAIMASTFGKMEGKEFNTSIVLPEYDDLFGAKLTYTSQDTTVYDNTGKLVAPVTEKKDVKFTVKISYTIAGKEADNFEVEKELTIKAVPANAASTFLEAALATEANKKYQSVVHAPWGQNAGNVVFEALPGMVWDVASVKLDARLEDDYQIFSQAEAGAALKLEAQYLRYQLVSIKGTYTKDETSTDIVLFFNIGISETPLNIISGIWRSSAQKDDTLSPEQGKYDLAGNVSYFDKKIGYVTETYGSGYFSGWSVTAVDADGKTWQFFPMEVMTVYIREDASGVYIDPANVNGGLAGAGGNWGVWYVNTTNKEVNIEVGVYGDVNFKYAEGHETASAVGSRLNIAMDGYALGFVADADGKIVHGSNNTKLQDGMSDKRAYIGGKSFKAGDKISEVMYNAIQLEGKAEKFDVVYTASDNLVFEQSNTGTFKKVEEESVVTYVAIKEGEEVAEADRFAPKYAKGAALTAEQYAELGEADKALVTIEYKVKAAFDYVVPNLFGDSSKGAVVNYLTIPANGYAMSWKYQFYGVGNPATVYAFCQDGLTLSIEHYDVHPLSSMDAEYATNYVKAAEELLEAAEIDHVAFETNVNAARARYDKLSGDTLADVFPADRLTALETQAVAFIDGDITALLASEPTEEGADKSQFAKDLATMWGRLYKTEGDAVVNKLSDEITGALTKKAAFDAKYAEYAAIDLHITYDYDGGYIQGFWKDTDKDLFLQTEFLPDLYEFMLAKGAWEGATAPTLEEFSSIGYWSTNYAQYADTLLGQYLFTAYKDGDTVNENYHDIIEGSNKFFNSPEGHKYIALLDYVNESCQTANGNGQDCWGRSGLTYVPQQWIQKQSYYTSGMVNTNLDNVVVTNSGTLLGAYRFAQWVCGTAQANYKSWIPNNVWSNIFDRQYTQENNVQIYHCTDLTVKLQDDPYKEGFKFLGWKFEDGKDAVITGSMFADITVYASWAPALEDLIEADLNVQLEGVFYGVPANIKYMATTETGTIADQVKTVGLGDYAIITGGKLFVIPKFAGIELGKDATADVTLDTKEAVQVYGTDGTTQFSCGLVMGETAPTPTNSYGHGALYHNAGEFKVTITDARNTYGRSGLPDPKENFGYDKFLFHYDEEKKLYVGTEVSPAANTSVTLEPGDFLWCPMTADRFCSGLTNCTGVSGVEGVWKGIEHPEAQIISTKDYLPVESPEWFTIEFYGRDGKLIKAFYPEEGNKVQFKTLDFVKNMIVEEGKPYKLLGWATTADATEASILKTVAELTPTADAKYYPVYQEVEAQDSVTLGEALEVLDGDAVTALADAVALVKENGTINVPAGSYKTAFTIDKPVTILGPNKDKKVSDERVAEADFACTITIEADSVTLNGIALSGANAITWAKTTTVANLTIIGVKSSASGKTTAGGRTAIVASDGAATNLVVKDTTIICNGTGGRDAIAIYGVVNGLTVEGCYFDNGGADGSVFAGNTYSEVMRINNIAGVVKVDGNRFIWTTANMSVFFGTTTNACTSMSFCNNIMTGKAGTNGTSTTLGYYSMPASCTATVIGNYFDYFDTGSTILFSKAKSGATATVKYNYFGTGVSYKWASVDGLTQTYEGNFYAAAQTTATSDYNVIQSKDALIAAYKSSDEYTALGSVCVYED